MNNIIDDETENTRSNYINNSNIEFDVQRSPVQRSQFQEIEELKNLQSNGFYTLQEEFNCDKQQTYILNSITSNPNNLVVENQQVSNLYNPNSFNDIIDNQIVYQTFSQGTIIEHNMPIQLVNTQEKQEVISSNFSATVEVSIPFKYNDNNLPTVSNYSQDDNINLHNYSPIVFKNKQEKQRNKKTHNKFPMLAFIVISALVAIILIIIMLNISNRSAREQLQTELVFKKQVTDAIQQDSVSLITIIDMHNNNDFSISK